MKRDAKIIIICWAITVIMYTSIAFSWMNFFNNHYWVIFSGSFLCASVLIFAGIKLFGTEAVFKRKALAKNIKSQIEYDYA